MRWATMLGLAGLAAATGLILWQGAGPVWLALVQAGWGILWVSLFHAVPMALNARAWQVLWPGARRPGLGFFTRVVWLREAVNALMPVARIGGEVVSARVMIQAGLKPSPVIASLVVDMTLCIGTQFLLTLIGLALLSRYAASDDLMLQVALGLLVTLPLLAALFVVQRVGLFELGSRLVRAMVGERWSGLAGSSARLDRRVRQFYRRRARIISCTLWQLLAWIVGAGEIWLALYFLGAPVSLADALMIEALAQAVSSAAFVVPGALGVQEGGFLVMGAVIGLSPELALALALTRRARDLICFLPPLIGWQVGEARRLGARGAAEPCVDTVPAAQQEAAGGLAPGMVSEGGEEMARAVTKVAAAMAVALTLALAAGLAAWPAAADEPVRSFLKEADAERACGSETVVWINESSKVYHLKGAQWYGKTKQGGYACRKDADRGGYHLAKNQQPQPAQPLQPQ